MAAITRKRLLLIRLSIFVVICCIVVFHSSEHSTVYKGKTIDQWLEETTKTATQDAAGKSLIEAGELGLPDLLRAATRRQSYFYTHIRPKLPAALKNRLPVDKRWMYQINALAVIKFMPQNAEHIVGTFRQAIPNCDDYGLRFIQLALFHIAQRNSTDLGEVARLIPDLHHALSTLNDRSGTLAAQVRDLETLVQASDQFQNLVPVGSSLLEARHFLESHQIPYKSHTNKLSTPGESLAGTYYPSGTNSIDGFHFVISSTSNTVSSIRVFVSSQSDYVNRPRILDREL